LRLLKAAIVIVTVVTFVIYLWKNKSEESPDHPQGFCDGSTYELILKGEGIE
jgi:hypothetical protein